MFDLWNFDRTAPVAATADARAAADEKARSTSPLRHRTVVGQSPLPLPPPLPRLPPLPQSPSPSLPACLLIGLVELSLSAEGNNSARVEMSVIYLAIINLILLFTGNFRRLSFQKSSILHLIVSDK